ncbi:MAG: hypothetical protein Q8O13_00830 [Candidatus Omnitrophota bacterium]|nr:hypothetical protein [Candidatus Omnitrophota bacterium]
MDAKKKLLRRDVAKKQAGNLSADNPDEYAEIVEENFGISYESGYIKLPRLRAATPHFNVQARACLRGSIVPFC